MLHSKQRYSKVTDLLFMLLFPRIWVGQVKNIHSKQTFIDASHSKTFPLPLARAIALLVSLLFSYLTVTPAFGQEPVGLGEVTPLKIGDTIPEELWDLPLQVVNHPDGKEVIRLSDYRDKKLIILDFWSSWCGSCIKSFPSLQTIQSQFNQDLKIILVNPVSSKDDKERILYVMNKHGRYKQNEFSIPSLLNDVVLTNYFQPKVFPRLIWINDKGIILDITGKSELDTGKLHYLLQTKGENTNEI